MCPRSSPTRLAAFAVCWALLCCSALAARVALIVPDENLESVLSAELSKQPGVEIVERAALSSIAREAALTGDFKKIAGAEIVAIGEKLPSGGTSLRLADPASGATLQIFQSPPGLDTALTAEWLSRRLVPWLSQSPAEVSHRFSLIGLRFEVDSEVNRQTERNLNLALATTLQGVPDTLVLERWKLNDLVFEKELAGRGDEPFWSAAQVLDGSLSEKDGRLHARMRIRTGDRETLAEAESPAADIASLAAKLASLAVNSDVTTNPSREAEAAAYVKEANWLLKHGLKKEAAQAAETAIALGDREQTTETLRIRAYAEAAYPENLEPNLRQEADSAYEKSDLPPERIAESVALATTVATLSEAYARKYIGMPRERNVVYEHPTVFAVRTLPFVFSVLRSAYKHGYHRTHPEEFRTLRSAVKNHISAVQALPLGSDREWLDARGTVLRHLIVFAPFWNDTPEETLKFMDRILSLDFENECRKGAFLARRNVSPDGFAPPAIPTPITTKRTYTGKPEERAPRLINWEDPDDPRLPALWRDYVEKKLASPDALVQADGLALLYSSQATYEEKNEIAPACVDFLEKNAGELHGLRGKLIWYQIRQQLSNACSWVRPKEDRQRVLAVFEKLLSGSQPIAPDILTGIDMCFPQEPRARAQPEDGQRILVTLSTYADTLGSEATEPMLRDIRQARNIVLRRFPELAPKPPADALPVTRAWIVAERTPEALRKGSFFDDDSGIWHDGHLWFLDSRGRRIWKVDPATFNTEILAPENRPVLVPGDGSTSRGTNLRRSYKRPVLAAGKIYLPEQDLVWTYEIEASTWKPLALPKARYSLWLVDGKVYAGFGDSQETNQVSIGEGSGVYEINPQDDSARLLFSSRRRPAEQAMDSIAEQRPLCVLPSPGNKPVVGLLKPLGFYRMADGEAVPVIDKKLLTNVVSRPEGTLFCHTVYNKNALLRGIQNVNAKGALETLIWNPTSDIPQPSEPIWKFPASIPDSASLNWQIDYRAAMWGDSLILLVYQYGTTGWGAGLTDLYIFRRGSAEATHIPLKFVLSTAAQNSLGRYHFGSETFAHPLIDHYGLIPTTQGIAITGYAMPGFWFIPWAELEARERKRP